MSKLLSQVVLKICNKFDLDLTKCVSVGTDGAKNCTSIEKGAVKFIKEASNSICTHSYCLSHLINLVVSSVSNLSNGSLVVDLINKLSGFFQYEKRKQVLSKYQTIPRKIKACSQTRQLERLESLSTFRALVVPVFKSLVEIEKWDDREIQKKAFKYRMQIENFDFILSLIFLEDVMKIVQPVAMCLQKIDIDLVNALNLVVVLAKQIEDRLLGNNALSRFQILIDEALKL